jgi:hypothetical protein
MLRPAMALVESVAFPDSGISSLETVWTLFQGAARRCPQATAVQFELSRRVTYHELEAMVHVLVLNL